MCNQTHQSSDNESCSDSNYTGSGNFYIGRYGPSEQYWFNGKIDEFRVWNTVRSELQIQEHMNASVSENDPGLFAYYRFNHTSGDALPDLSLNHFDGILNIWILKVCG
ncbi:MAG: hypothetical protein OMM_12194 [Candidatus Magnetoglobus multicellularis str. Araruama]|uniref:LamG-like jellyroll fold domain-containing protein n=1 Tax=Candidatus Magnetoglobus multicellularis str. Araruama TaxID=890399 RepID=A0A1V1NWG5_9BACT|nr:MAG: hypothetical protein OMM_12194 [Candidatus Magnetoglobus multicellularis str. Araruama]